MSKLDEVLARLNPKTAAAFVKASEVETELLSTPSLGINMAIGGLRYGAIHTLWGTRSSGKSLFCLGLVREAQKNGKACAWVDAEKNFDPVWAAKNGVDVDNLLVSHTTNMVDTANNAVDLVNKGIDLLIIDSISVQLPQSYFQDGELKGLEGTNQIGTFSKNYASMVSMINNVNHHTNVVVISQVRNKFGQHHASKSLMGGEASEHINSTIIKFWALTAKDKQITKKIPVGNMILERPVGRKVIWTIDKARGAGHEQTNDYDLYFAGPEVGIDLTGEIITYGIEFGIINKSGNWLAYGDMKSLNGESKFRDYLKENPDVQDLIYKELMEAVHE